ncbi:hypothetical protein HK102_010991 [Quaeritorhiza haematococci]|nr:hypothetical protein HK102_010991 [Quaeritorhiza haematococci]
MPSPAPYNKVSDTSAQAPPNLVSLPSEIIHDIVKHLRTNKKALSSLAWTCQHTSQLVLPLLWQHASLIVHAGLTWVSPLLSPDEVGPKYIKHASFGAWISNLGKRCLPFIHHLSLSLVVESENFGTTRHEFLPKVQKDIKEFFTTLTAVSNVRHLLVSFRFQGLIAKAIFEDRGQRWADESIVSQFMGRPGVLTSKPSSISPHAPERRKLPMLTTLTIKRHSRVADCFAAEHLAFMIVRQQAPKLNNFKFSVPSRTHPDCLHVNMDTDGNVEALDLTHATGTDSKFLNYLDLSTVKHLKISSPTRDFATKLKAMVSLESVDWIDSNIKEGFHNTMAELIRLTSAPTSTTPYLEGPCVLTRFKLKPIGVLAFSKLDEMVPPLFTLLTNPVVSVYLRTLKIGFYSLEVLDVIKSAGLCPNLVVLSLGSTPDQEESESLSTWGLTSTWATAGLWRLACEATAHMTQLETLSLKMLRITQRFQLDQIGDIPRRLPSLRKFIVKGRTDFSMSYEDCAVLVGRIGGWYPQLNVIVVGLGTL